MITSTDTHIYIHTLTREYTHCVYVVYGVSFIVIIIVDDIDFSAIYCTIFSEYYHLFTHHLKNNTIIVGLQ